MRLAVVNLPDAAGENIIKDLFNGAWCRGARIGGTTMPPLSLLYAWTAARPHAADGVFVDAVQERIGAGAVAARIAGADLLVAHTSAYTMADDASTLLALRERVPGATCFVFGNLDAARVRELLARGVADLVCGQDPEEAVADVAERLATAGRAEGPIAGVATRADATPAPRAAGDLDAKPVPDRRPILRHRYRNPLAVTRRWTTALTARGCPYTCTFCNTPGYYGRSYRRHSVPYVLAELRQLRALGYEEVFFRDDLFHAGRVEELCEAMLSAGLGLRWSCNHRVDSLPVSALPLMARAGCHTIKFGVESGDDDVLREVGKPAHHRAEAMFEACARAGLRTHAHLMVGLPGETREQMARTVALLRRLDPWSFTMGMFTPHPGSALHARMVAEGQAVGGRWKEAVEGNPSAVSDEELRALLRRTYLGFYLSPRRMARYLRRRERWGDLARAGAQLVRRFALGGA